MPTGLFTPAINQPLSVIVDNTTTSGYTYVCEAYPGAASSDARWRIARYDNVGGVMWAGIQNGVPCFNQIADNRASLTYTL